MNQQGVRIAILVEGETEKAFQETLHSFLKGYLQAQQISMPTLRFIPQRGRIPKGDKLKRVVENLLYHDGYDAVIALTDVYTGTKDFQNAADAKQKMNTWVGNHPDFYPHVALHDFEAWLLPYWSTIQKKAKHNRAKPGSEPEKVNHDRPPSYHLKEIFERGQCKESYNKIIHAKAIFKGQDLTIAIEACPELKAFINCILRLCGAPEL